MNKRFLAALGLATALLVPTLIWAANMQEQLTAAPDASEYSQTVLGATSSPNLVSTSTGSPVMNLTYTGTAADAEVQIVTGTTTGFIRFFAPAATADATIGGNTYGLTSGVYDFAPSSSNTLGALCDLINNSNSGSPNWHCTLISGVRSDYASQVLPVVNAPSAGVMNAGASGGWNVPIGTNTFISLGIIPSPGRRVALQQCVVLGEGNAAAPVKAYVYGVPRKYQSLRDPYGALVTDSFLAWQSYPITAATATWFPTAYAPADNWLEFAPNFGSWGGTGNIKYSPIGQNQYNGHVVVRVGQPVVGNGTETASDYLSCQWQER